MFEFKASFNTQSADRILKPAAVLRRLRPVTLVKAASILSEHCYLGKALALHREHGPMMLNAYDYPRKALPHWTEIFNDFLRNVEAWGWFGIDWDLLDADYNGWMEMGEEGADQFAQYLDYIPIQLFGFSDYDESWPEEYPQVAMLRALLDPGWDQRGEMLVSLCDQYEIDTDWVAYSWGLQERLEGGEFDELDEPLCWLPEIARIACGRTGNVILDCANYIEEEPLGWRWDRDLEKARRCWAEAKPSIEHWRKFLNWFDGPKEMRQMVELLIGELPPEEDEDGEAY